MKKLTIYAGLHILVAVVLSLVVNFSYLLLPIVTERGMAERSSDGDDVGAHNSGVLHITTDLHGYVVCDCALQDSIYVSAWQVSSHKLQDGDHLTFTTRTPRGVVFSQEQLSMAHNRVDKVITVNGENFDIDTLYDRPSRTVEFIWQIIYYALVAYLLIQVFVWRYELSSQLHHRFRNYWYRFVVALLVLCVAICFAPVMSFDNGVMRIVFFFKSDARDHVYLVMLTKSVFVFVVTLFYTRIYTLMRQRQTMIVENERLKTENMSTRYNMLVGQINPHFFFNSLNSLAMLVREGDQQRSLEYIDQLSYTFRYIIQNGKSSTTTLKEELEFAEAYAYLFKIRYADKLFFDFDVDDKYRDWTLPALSLQPLIGNTVKHNSITTKNPLRVTIRVVNGVLEIENKKNPKLDVEPSTGIGLNNLRSRWQIIAGTDIEIIDEAERFMVRLPLENPNNKR